LTGNNRNIRKHQEMNPCIWCRDKHVTWEKRTYLERLDKSYKYILDKLERFLKEQFLFIDF